MSRVQIRDSALHGQQPEDLQTRAEWGMADNHHIAADPAAALSYYRWTRQALEWRMAGAADWQRVELAPGEVREYPLEE